MQYESVHKQLLLSVFHSYTETKYVCTLPSPHPPFDMTTHPLGNKLLMSFTFRTIVMNS